MVDGNRRNILNREILHILHDLLTEENSYVEIYKTMVDLKNEVASEGDNLEEFGLRFTDTHSQPAGGAFRAPVASQFATILYIRESEQTLQHVFVVAYSMTEGLIKVCLCL
ncbi:hypothetical protein CDIK_2918 [Cucumispora dikerogammari]|nr:hypothetical protein CDIK_2918 [Cucumispora dikerogammari]